MMMPPLYTSNFLTFRISIYRFLLGFVVPWDSPLSFRALFCVKPFMPDLELSQVNGTLFPRKTSITETLASRLIALWRHISKSRTHFETEPDTGFIGKGLTRHMNRMWNYVFKGFLGTIVILFLYPIVCVAACAGSILLAVTAPLWMPCAALIFHLYMMIVYDFDSPDSTENRYCVVLAAVVWNILIQGLLQPFLAISVATVLCPIASICVLIGTTRRSFFFLKRIFPSNRFIYSVQSVWLAIGYV